MRYRVSIYGSGIYKEAVLYDNKSLTIGTHKDCQIRFDKRKFFGDFKIVIEQENDSYFVYCEDDLFLKNVDGTKERFHNLIPGDHIAVCYGGQDVSFLYFDFSEDFGYIQDNYDRCIKVPATGSFTIGGRGNYDIAINDDKIGSSFIVFMAGSSESVNSQIPSNTLNSSNIPDQSKISDSSNSPLYTIDVSRASHEVSINGTLVRDDRISLKKGQFVSFFGYIFFYSTDGFLTCDFYDIQTRFKQEKISWQSNHLKYPLFIRNARQRYVMPQEIPSVLQPKELQDNGNGNDILGTVLPMCVTMIAMIAVRSMIGSNIMFMLYFGLSMGMSVVMTIVNYFRNKKKRKKDEEKRIVTYNAYIERKEEEIEKLRLEERQVAEKMNTSAVETLIEVENFDSRLFEREPVHEDFLDVWIGTGTVESVCQVEYREQDFIDTEDEMMDYPRQMNEKYKRLENMPITLHLAQVSAIGFVGNRTKLYQIAKNLIITIAGQHFFKDVKMIFFINEEDGPYFSWVRWLQNSMDDEHIARFVVYDDDSRKTMLQFLYSELSMRESVAGGHKEGIFSVHYVVFMYRSDMLGGHPVTSYVGRARELGFTFLFFDEHEEFVHHDVEQRVYLEPGDNRGTVVDTADGEKVQPFVYPHISLDQASAAALKLAPVFIEEISLESTLTKNISLYTLLGIMSAYDIDLRSRWASSNVCEDMEVPIGVVGSGAPLYLNIHENGHGPHGLVAGTTGSGKSELLQTFILSLATRFSPYDVGFVLIDFKGGGMANQFRHLPHLCGSMTNIDGKQIERSLMSIRAELLKRQELFARYDVNRIDDYIMLYKAGKASVPLPHLILIVDEFAELKSDQPEFMKELISTARIGRSLGVHMILATQKPAGVVNDQIWSNSRFKLCLKVQDKADSNEVLKSPLAAEIREPGRCYLQVGNNEIFELFQSAYSGAPALVEGVDEAREFEICRVDLAGRRELVYAQKNDTHKKAETQMEALIKYIDEFCNEEGIHKLSPICLPPLETNISYTLEDYRNGRSQVEYVYKASKQKASMETRATTDSNVKTVVIESDSATDRSLKTAVMRPGLENDGDINTPVMRHGLETDGDIKIPVGIYDNPSRQEQGVMELNLTEGNLIVLGAAQNGKTNLLQVIIRGLVQLYTPKDVKIYILDFASMMLSNFRELNQVVGVVTAADEERMRNYIKLMKKELESRKLKLSDLGLSSFSSYREAGYREFPQIVVLVDNYPMLKNAYPEMMEDLHRIIQEGPSVGISFVVTAMNASGLGFKLISSFFHRYSFSLNDKNDYAYVFERCRLYPDDVPGRCVIKVGREYQECQIYNAFDADKEIERIEKIRDFIKEYNDKYSQYEASAIPEVPQVVTLETIADAMAGSKPYEIIAGISFDTTKPVSIDLQTRSGVIISGDVDSAKNRFIRYMVATLANKSITGRSKLNDSYDKRSITGTEIYILDNFTGNLKECSHSQIVKGYTMDFDEYGKMVVAVSERLKARYESLKIGNIDNIDNSFIILLINTSEYYSHVMTKRDIMASIKQMMTTYKTLGICVILTDMQGVPTIGAPELVRMVKESRCFIVFDNLKEQHLFDVSTKTQHKFHIGLKEDEAYMCDKTSLFKIKIPTQDEDNV